MSVYRAANLLLVTLAASMARGEEPFQFVPRSDSKRIPYEEVAADPVSAITPQEGFVVNDSPCVVMGEKRTEDIRRLLALLEKTEFARPTEDVHLEVVCVLARLRAKEAVPALAERLDWLPAWLGPTASPCYTHEYYAAAWALMEIGSACVPDMVRVIASEESTPQERENAAWVILACDGQSNEIDPFKSPDGDEDRHLDFLKEQAIARIQHYAGPENRRQPAVQERIDEAIKFIRAYQPGTRFPGEEGGETRP
jgi:hypothetical protein